MKKAVIFDLDGTLLNTIEDITDSLNIALKQAGFSPYTSDEVKFFVGSGVSIMIERALKGKKYDEKTFALIRDIYMKEYHHRQAHHTRPYEGIKEVIQTLHHRGVLLGLLSNKPDEDTKRVVEHYFGLHHFDLVFGQREGIPIKPDPTALLEIVKQLHVKKEDCLFVGDSDVDMLTACNAQMEKVGVLWGFRDASVLKQFHAEHMIMHPDELLKIVEK